jgi:hypothetical protein
VNASRDIESRGGPDFLSVAEEDVLAGMRVVLAGVRELGANDELARLAEALVYSRGAIAASPAEDGSIELKFGDVHVSLRPTAEGIELSFPGESR